MYFFFFKKVFIATKANPWGEKGVFRKYKIINFLNVISSNYFSQILTVKHSLRCHEYHSYNQVPGGWRFLSPVYCEHDLYFHRKYIYVEGKKNFLAVQLPARCSCILPTWNLSDSTGCWLGSKLCFKILNFWIKNYRIHPFFDFQCLFFILPVLSHCTLLIIVHCTWK